MLSPRNVKACGCQRMVCGSRPDGHRPRFYSSATSTPRCLHSTAARRSVRRLSHRSMLGLVVESAPRTVFLSSSRLLPSPSRSSTASLRLHLCGMRARPPMLLLLLSPHSRELLNRSLATGSTSGTSILCLRAHVARIS